MTEGIDFIQRARDLAPMLDEAGDEIERRRELPEHVVAALIDGGFFRMLQPRFLDGAELRPVQFTQVTEALAQTNASVGWCVGQNNGCSMTAAYLDREVAREMYWLGARQALPMRPSRSRAAIASAASGASPVAAIMPGGSAPTCPWLGPARSAPCCFPSPACR
jgi:alkylation response protein AidB-like acyl-CoA dehydrogenase